MRKIKFRIWAKEAKFWMNPRAMFVQGMDGDRDYFTVHGISPETIVIQQFTGLKDKNSKEIYEGDLVKIDPQHITNVLPVDLPPKYTAGKVTWIDGEYRILQEGFGMTTIAEFVTCNCCGCGLEVIGNIFESNI